MSSLRELKNTLSHPAIFTVGLMIMVLIFPMIIPEVHFPFRRKLIGMGILGTFFFQYLYQTLYESRIVSGITGKIGMKVLLSLLYCIIVGISNPDLFIDDAGFILRYLDHFKEGCFYCYNVEDGAVFGISSLIHGIFTGFWAWMGLSSEHALLLSNYTGLFFTSILVFSILDVVVDRPELHVILWVAVMFGSHAMLIVSVKGMESPLHLAMCLAPIYYWLKGKYRWMWIGMALAVMSKLTAVPVVGILGIAFLLENLNAFKSPTNLKQLILDAVLFGGLPLLGWVVFSFVVFDGPLPQSGYAKYYHHLHSEGSFPFLKYFYDNPFQLGMFVLFWASWLGHIAVALIKKEYGALKGAVLGGAFLGVLALYFFFNPGERMKWYYVLPEMLMLLQIVLSLEWLSRKTEPKPTPVPIYCFMGFFFLLTWTQQAGRLNWTNKYIANTEWERKEIGELMGKLALPEDTVAVGHGLTGRHVPGYVIDLAGLNSKMVTDYRLNTDSIIRDFRPHWVVLHNWPDVAAMMSKYNYELFDSHFEITLNKGLAWRIYRRNSDPFTQAHLNIVPGDSIRATDRKFSGVHRVQRVIGKDIRIAYQDSFPGNDSLILGIYRKNYPFNLIVLDIAEGDTSKTVLQVPSDRFRGIVRWDAWEARVPVKQRSALPGRHEFIIYPEPPFEGKIEIIDPALKEMRRLGS